MSSAAVVSGSCSSALLVGAQGKRSILQMRGLITRDYGAPNMGGQGLFGGGGFQTDSNYIQEALKFIKDQKGLSKSKNTSIPGVSMDKP